MPRIQRQPRPLSRDRTVFRDDTLFIVACDDTYAPKQYFDFFRITRVQIHVVETKDGTSSAHHVLERLKAFMDGAEPDDEFWMLLDTDHYIEPSHIGSFMRALQDANQAGIKVALSRPCFEVWLLLHHREVGNADSLVNANAVVELLRTTLGSYSKSNLKKEHYEEWRVSDACDRARQLDTNDTGGLIPNCCGSRVYRLWESIVNCALPDQLPEALRRISR